MKFLVLSLLVAVCSAVPTYNYQSSSSFGGYQPTARYGSRWGSSGSGFGASSYAAPQFALISLGGGGYGSGFGGASRYSGISSGLTGGFSGFGGGYNTGYTAAAPATATYQLVPVQTAAPAVQTVAFQSAPVAYAQSYNTGYRAQQHQAAAFSGLAQHRSDSFESVVPAAVNQIARTVEYVNVPHNEQPAQAQVVEVEPSDNPVHLHFKTRSSTLSVSQAHTPAQATEAKHETAQDEIQRLSIEVTKPVIQEVKEVVTPYRQVVQEIHPVQESLHTIVSKGEQRQQYQQQQNYGQQYNQQVNYAQVAAPVATVAAVQPVQTFAVQAAAPAIQTVAIQPVQTVVESANYVQAVPVASSFQSANYVQAVPAVATTTGLYQSGSSGSSTFGGNQFQGARFHSTPLSTGSSSTFSSSSSSSYKPIVSKYQKNDY